MLELIRRVLCVTVLLGIVSACGEDPPEHAGHEHDGGEHPEAKCDPALPPLAVGFEELGAKGLIKATVVSVDPLPLLKGSADFVIDFVNAAGEPVTDLVIDRARTWMPVHGHPGNFEPDVSALPEPGRFMFEGFHFTMRGPWLVQINVSSPSVGIDDLDLQVCVEPE